MAAATFSDDVSAIVVDMGSRWTKAGCAGEDSPSVLVHTALGKPAGSAAVETDGQDSEMKDITKINSDGSSITTKSKPRKTTLGNLRWQPGMDVVEPISERIVQDWHACETLLDEVYESYLRIQSNQHPLLLSESPWLARASRERLCEYAFETLQVPAYFCVRDAVLSSFASGKPTSLVVDSSASCTSVTPVYDGYTVNKSIQKSVMGGDFLTRECKALHTEEINAPELHPRYRVSSKEAVPPSQKPKFKLRDTEGTTDSYKNFMEWRMWDEFKEATVATVPDQRYDPEGCKNRFSRPYEFPNGYNQLYHLTRFQLGEIFFQPGGFARTLTSLAPDAPVVPIQQLVHDAVNMCDVDIRTQLFSNIVLTGGNSLIPGFVERLDLELQSATPQVRIKIAAPGNSVERRFSCWIGGSILASLGTFHQMWIGKLDYEEYGKSIVERRCL